MCSEVYYLMTPFRNVVTRNDVSTHSCVEPGNNAFQKMRALFFLHNNKNLHNSTYKKKSVFQNDRKNRSALRNVQILPSGRNGHVLPFVDFNPDF